MNRRNFIGMIVGGIVAGPMLLKQAAQAKPSPWHVYKGKELRLLAIEDFHRNPSWIKAAHIERMNRSLTEPCTWLTINGVTYKATDIRVNGQRVDLNIDRAP